MAGTGFFFDERCLWHSTGGYALLLKVGGWVQPLDGGGHPEAPSTKRRMKALMDVSGLSAKLDVRSAPPATEEDVLRIHTANHVRTFKAGSDADGGLLGLDAPFGPGSFEIALQSTGLVIGALDAVLTGQVDNAYALSRPPGHHALADSGMGFCYFANIAIAIEVARQRHGLGRVAVIDWDVHHGNGTQDIFWSDPSVLYASTHQMPLYPGTGAKNETGAGNIVNAPLIPDSGSDLFRDAFRSRVLPALDNFRPDMIIVSAGFDAHRRDPLASINLDEDDFDWATGQLMERAQRHSQGRLVSLLEGGYDLEGLAYSVAAHVGRMMKG